MKDPRRKKLTALKEKRLLLDYNVDMFGNAKVDKDQVELQKRKLDAEIKKIETEIADIEQNNLYKGSFEWRFEFPEVLDDKGDFVGFDVIIGNPPYFSISKDESLKHLTNSYETFESTGDIYVLFYEKGHHLLKNNGLLSFITSNKWMRASYGKKLRKFLFLNSNPQFLFDFSWFQVFENASVDTNILTIAKSKNIHSCNSLIANSDFSLEVINDYVNNNSIEISFPIEDYWNVSTTKSSNLKTTILSKGKPLENWKINIYRGVLTGLNEAFIIEEETKNELIKKDIKNAEIIKPLLRGRDIERYSKNFANLWLINSHNGIKEKQINRIDVIKDYPTIYEHLLKFEAKAKSRTDSGDDWTNLRNCAYLDEFAKEKLVWAETMRVHKKGDRNFPRFGYDDEGFYTDKTVFICVGKNLKYLLAVLNSNIGRWMIQEFVTKLDTGGYMMQKVFLDKIPIPEISESAQAPIIAKVEQILATKRENPSADTTQLEAEIDAMVYKLYNLTPEEIAIVEGKS